MVTILVSVLYSFWTRKTASFCMACGLLLASCRKAVEIYRSRCSDSGMLRVLHGNCCLVALGTQNMLWSLGVLSPPPAPLSARLLSPYPNMVAHTCRCSTQFGLVRLCPETFLSSCGLFQTCTVVYLIFFNQINMFGIINIMAPVIGCLKSLAVCPPHTWVPGAL